jgi:L-lactate dehydrogenase complex protein LldG
LLANDLPRDEPAAPEVWPQENPGTEQMRERFCEELQAISGETVRCRSMDEARSRLRQLLDQEHWSPLGAMDRPVCQIAAGLGPDRVTWAQPDWTPQTMAELPAGLVEAECLLADTGTAMIACNTPQERLMCYLPPACIVVAPAGRLAEHLPAAWPEIARRVAATRAPCEAWSRMVPDRRGEFVFVTGPSRTADIEKILILGVHGPKRLIVLLIGNDS